jgi:MobA/MobL family
MAIYHLSASIVKRSAGRSVTAAAAYRAGSKIEDLTTGLVHDYTRKKGVDFNEIISPVSLDKFGNEWLLDREKLWNKVEEIEKRKDAQLAREITIAIPVELDRASQIELVREYVRSNFVEAGMIADINIHHLDGNNPHAHVLLTMRNLQTNPEGNIEFGLKNTDWNSKELLLSQRKSWEQINNKYLAAAGSEAKIDCRSLEDQGSPYIPQIHVGVHAAAMKRKGIPTDRSEEFDRIQSANNDIRTRLEEIYEQEYTEPELELNEADNERKEKDHRLAELIIEAMKQNPYPRSKREADRAKQGLERNHARFNSSHLTSYYSIVLKTKKNIESIEITIGGARPRLFTFEKEDNRWIKKTFYHKTAFPATISSNKSLKEHIDNAVEDFNENTIDRYYHKLQKVRIEDEKLQLKENKLGKLIIDLSEKLQSERFYIEPYYIYAGKNEILIGKRRSSLYCPSPFELKSDSQGNFAREYIQHDRDEESIINYFTQIIINYQNELEQEENDNYEVNILTHFEKVRSNIDRQISTPTSPPKIRSGDVVSRITLILQKLANQDEQKLEEPKTIESKPVIKPETIKFEPVLEESEIEFKPASEDFKSVIPESDLIIEEEPPIKVAKINQPIIKKATKTKTRRPNRGSIE